MKQNDKFVVYINKYLKNIISKPMEWTKIKLRKTSITSE